MRMCRSDFMLMCVRRQVTCELSLQILEEMMAGRGIGVDLSLRIDGPSNCCLHLEDALRPQAFHCYLKNGTATRQQRQRY